MKAGVESLNRRMIAGKMIRTHTRFDEEGNTATVEVKEVEIPKKAEPAAVEPEAEAEAEVEAEVAPSEAEEEQVASFLNTVSSGCLRHSDIWLMAAGGTGGGCR